MSVTADARDAARLVHHGLAPKARPARDADYAELVRRYRTDPAFAALVEAVCGGLNLAVLDVDERHGIVAVPVEESHFALRISDYARRTASSAPERVLHALAHLGVATMAYPRPADLSNPDYVGRVTAQGVDAFIREAARRLSQQLADTGESADPPADEPSLELAWRLWDRRAATGGTEDRRQLSRSTLGIVNKALGFLAEQGLLTRQESGDGEVYRTTSRYRIHVLEAGPRMFGSLVRLGLGSVTDPAGTLIVTGEWTTDAVNEL